MKQGDIFIQKFEDGRNIFGRVLIDFVPLFRKKVLDKNNHALSFFQKSYLVESYKQFTTSTTLDDKEVVVSGMFMDDFAIKKEFWEKVGQQKVEAEEIDFPEYLMNWNGQYSLYKGEVVLPIRISHDQFDAFKCKGTLFPGTAMKDITLYHMGNKELIPEGWREKRNISGSDLRFKEGDIREKIWKLAGEDPALPYTQLAEKHGVPTTRLV